MAEVFVSLVTVYLQHHNCAWDRVVLNKHLWHEKNSATNVFGLDCI